MTKDEALDLALEALKYIHEGANNQGPHTGISWRCVAVKAEPAIKAIKQARALDKMAENARELGLDYEPADGTQVSKVWWDGEKLMAKPIPLEDIYQPVQDSTCSETLRAQGKAYPRTCRKCGLGPCIGAPKKALAQPSPVQEPVGLIARLKHPEQHYEFTNPKKANAVLMSLCQEAADALAAQPAVPDAMTSADIQEHIEYVAGWNECRQAMLKGMKL